MTVQQAAAIDQKMDDGSPLSGTVMAVHINYHAFPLVTGASGNLGGAAIGTNATAPSSITCYDNGSVNGATQQYSTTQSGNNLNCALSFKFQ